MEDPRHQHKPINHFYTPFPTPICLNPVQLLLSDCMVARSIGVGRESIISVFCLEEWVNGDAFQRHEKYGGKSKTEGNAVSSHVETLH